LSRTRIILAVVARADRRAVGPGIGLERFPVVHHGLEVLAGGAIDRGVVEFHEDGERAFGKTRDVSEAPDDVRHPQRPWSSCLACRRATWAMSCSQSPGFGSEM
jgi:hypothetical protein